MGSWVCGVGGGRLLNFLRTEAAAYYWVLEYYTLILFLVLGSYSSYLYLKSIYFFFSGSTPKLSYVGLSEVWALNPKP